MSAYCPLTSADFEAGCQLVISDEQRRNLGRLERWMDDRDFLSLGFPQPVFRIDPDLAVGCALAPEIEKSGSIKFSRSLQLSQRDYAALDTAGLSALAYELLRPECDHRKRAYYPVQQEKIMAQNGLFYSMLRLDHATFEAIEPMAPRAPITIRASYDQTLVSPDSTRQPLWHTDAGSRNARGYIIRSEPLDEPSIATEFIRNSEMLLKPAARHLLHEIDQRQELFAQETMFEDQHRDRFGHSAARESGNKIRQELYERWKDQLVKLGLYYQPQAYDAIVIAGDTFHRSHQPPHAVASGFARLLILPEV